MIIGWSIRSIWVPRGCIRSSVTCLVGEKVKGKDTTWFFLILELIIGLISTFETGGLGAYLDIHE